MAPKVSIVINTLNRGESLARTLQSLRYLDYPGFEVIVVNGPSTDCTAEVIARHEREIKAGTCPVANLSVSRNIGIAMAAGEVVAFIDDDATPEPEWLARLVAGYDVDEVGGVGGFVYDHTGYTFQARYIVCDRFGGARMDARMNPTALFNFPQASEYCSHMGTNSSFRRDVLVRIGGFDEEFEYYLDETDVCVRMVDAGYVVKFVEDAFVHHKFLPSHIRNENRVVRNWYSIIKNKAYFSVKNGSQQRSLPDILSKLREYIEEQRRSVQWAIGQKLLPEPELATFDETAARALKDGLERGLGRARRFITPETLARHAAPFKPFRTILPPPGERLTVCYLSQDYPPRLSGGIARLTQALASGLARRGHLVHVVTRGEGHDTVDFEDGVWVHRIVPREVDAPGRPEGAGVVRRNHDYSRTVHEEVRRIHSHHPIDVIEAPIWDAEGLHCLLDEELRDRTVISLETTLKLAAEAQRWDLNEDLRKAIEVEEYVLGNARTFHAISRGIVHSVQDAYGLSIPASRIGLVPLGLADRAPEPATSGGPTGQVTVLFVGRLERRKGIDVLLSVAPGLLRSRPNVRLVLLGDDTIPAEDGRTYKQQFLEAHAGDPVLERIEFHGRVSDEQLFERYRACDVFVAPSRYESFGLIFLEAMMFGKPVIGCAAGGMPEVIDEGVSGLLAQPGDAASLGAALAKLMDDPELRRRLGRGAREAFEARFTLDKMVDGVLELYQRVARGRPAAATGARPLESRPTVSA